MRVVIADDAAIIRTGLARLLADAGVEVCGVAAVLQFNRRGARFAGPWPGHIHHHHPTSPRLHFRIGWWVGGE